MLGISAFPGPFLNGFTAPRFSARMFIHTCINTLQTAHPRRRRRRRRRSIPSHSININFPPYVFGCAVVGNNSTHPPSSPDRPRHSAPTLISVCLPTARLPSRSTCVCVCVWRTNTFLSSWRWSGPHSKILTENDCYLRLPDVSYMVEWTCTT